ncbi:hypothetical protein WA158_005574 [Blastocystis sp. Blastoise]
MPLSVSQIKEFCNQQSELYPTLKADYDEICRLYTDKLWYQLTEYLLGIMKNPEKSIQHNLIDLFNTVIKPTQTKIDNLSYCSFICTASHQFYPNYEEALQFVSECGDLQRPEVLDKIYIQEAYQPGKKVEAVPLYKKFESAYLLIMIEAAFLYIQLNNYKNARNYLDNVQKLIDSMNFIEPSIYASYYKTSIALFKKYGSYDSIYPYGLKLFSYISVNELPTEEVTQLALDIVLSAIVGKTTYSFGELLNHPLSSFLKSTEYTIIIDILTCIYNGDVKKWHSLCESNMQQINQFPILTNNINTINEKVVNVCLVEMAFHRSSNDRIISFEDISKTTGVPLKDIENYIIHCISLHLVNGSINGEDQTFTVTSIQPRILDRDHINSVNNHLKNWTMNLQNIISVLEKQTHM